MAVTDSGASTHCCRRNGKLRDALLNGEIFYTLKEAQVVIERWRCHDHTIRPQVRWDTVRQPLKRRHPRRS